MTWRDKTPAPGEVGGDGEARVSLHPSVGWAPEAPGSWVLTHPQGSPDPKCESTTAPFPHLGPFFSTARSRVGSKGWGYLSCLLLSGSSHHSSEGGPSESRAHPECGVRPPCPGLPASPPRMGHGKACEGAEQWWGQRPICLSQAPRVPAWHQAPCAGLRQGLQQ